MTAAGNQSEDGPAEFPKGPRSTERHRIFLDDALSDHLLRAVVTLAMELSVTRERLAAIEALLASQGTLPKSAIDMYEPENSEQRAREESRARLIDSLIGPFIQNLAGKAPDY